MLPLDGRKDGCAGSPSGRCGSGEIGRGRSGRRVRAPVEPLRRTDPRAWQGRWRTERWARESRYGGDEAIRACAGSGVPPVCGETRTQPGGTQARPAPEHRGRRFGRVRMLVRSGLEGIRHGLVAVATLDLLPARGLSARACAAGAGSFVRDPDGRVERPTWHPRGTRRGPRRCSRLLAHNGFRVRGCPTPRLALKLTPGKDNVGCSVQRGRPAIQGRCANRWLSARSVCSMVCLAKQLTALFAASGIGSASITHVLLRGSIRPASGTGPSPCRRDFPKRACSRHA